VVLWAVFGLMVTVALVLAPYFNPAGPAAAWRFLAALVAVAFGGAPARAVLFGRGPRAIRGFEWGTDGVWHLTLIDGTTRTGRLIHATATMGPWILLAWEMEGSPRRYALIEESRVGSAAFRGLKGRLRLQARRENLAPASVFGPVAP
jgi:hypothetical protein